MRIIYLHQYFTTPEMSGGTRSYEIGRRLAAYGHDVHMITTDFSGQHPGATDWVESNVAGMNVHRYPMPYSNHDSFKKRIVTFFKFAYLAAGKAVQINADLVYATSTPLTIAIPAVRAAHKLGVPMVLEVRDLWPETPIAVGALKGPFTKGAARWLERYAYRNAEHIVALSPDMKSTIVRQGHPEGLVSVIPNSCDFDVFDVGTEPGRVFRRRFDWLQERPLFVYAGTYGVINGVGYIVRLAAKVKAINPEVRFLLVGSGREEDQIRDLARSAGVLDDNFFMLPPMKKHELAAVMSAADISCSTVIDLPELWKNSANKFFDTLASRTPVAVNHEGWMADVIRERRLGLVLHATDLDAAARRLAESIGDQTWLRAAGRAAHQAAREQFDRDVLVARLHELLIRVVGDPKAGSTPDQSAVTRFVRDTERSSRPDASACERRLASASREAMRT